MAIHSLLLVTISWWRIVCVVLLMPAMIVRVPLVVMPFSIVTITSIVVMMVVMFEIAVLLPVLAIAVIFPLWRWLLAMETVVSAILAYFL